MNLDRYLHGHSEKRLNLGPLLAMTIPAHSASSA